MRSGPGLAAAILLLSLSVGAQSPAPSAVLDAAWIAVEGDDDADANEDDGDDSDDDGSEERGRVLKVSSATGEVLLEIPATEEIRALAVDDSIRQTVWTLTEEGVLRTFDFGGTPRFFLGLPEDDESSHADLAVDRRDGSAWVAFGERVFVVDPAGLILQEIPLARPAVAIAFDETTGRAWVATKKTAAAYDAMGTVLATLPLRPKDTVRDLDVDVSSGAVWVGLSESVRKYSAAGALLASRDLAHVERVAADSLGGAWIGTQDRLLRVDASAQVAAAAPPFGSPKKILALAADPADASAWGATLKTLRHIDSAGTLRHELSRDLHFRAVAVSIDRIPPALAFLAPPEGAFVGTPTPSLVLSWSDLGRGVDPATLQVFASGTPLAVSCVTHPDGATCIPQSIPDGFVELTADVADYAGNVSGRASIGFTVDTVAPQIAVSAPMDGLVTKEPSLSILGQVTETNPASFEINGIEVPLVSPALSFAHSVTLAEGGNLLVLIARDLAANTSTRTLAVTLDTIAPEAPDAGSIDVSDPVNGIVTVTGAAGAVEAGTTVRITNLRTGDVVEVEADVAGSFTAAIAAFPGDSLSILAIDRAGNIGAAIGVTVASRLPPDPSLVASAIDPTIATDLFTATAFLYSGASPIQSGVAPWTIEPTRVVVLRGTVRTRDGAPLSGVDVTIAGRPEFGATKSRADGAWDLVANGGGALTVQFDLAGFLRAQRTVDTGWREFVAVPEVRLVAIDPAGTFVDFSGASSTQIARSSVSFDDAGSRQMTLVLPAGVRAEALFPDGRREPLLAGSLHATEFTVGPNGPTSMPAMLPAESAYTTAWEFSVDEAIDAKSIVLTEPASAFLENFLGFPVGEAVPVGTYDSDRAVWNAEPNGRIIRIASVDGGLASLIVDASGAVADEAVLAALGIDLEDRVALASLYAPGTSLLFFRVGHFTQPWDCNWPYYFCPDCFGPYLPNPEPQDETVPESCKESGFSTLDCQNQTVTESVPVTGTPWSLTYASDRVPGRKTHRTLSIPLSGPSVSTSLRRIELEVVVAGRVLRQFFPPSPNQSTVFEWDGRDAYGRALQGRFPATVRVSYHYDLVYSSARMDMPSFGMPGNAIQLVNRSVPSAKITQSFATALSAWDARGFGLGGWSLSPHHLYDYAAATLHGGGPIFLAGDGARRDSSAAFPVLGTLAGGGRQLGEGIPPRSAAVNAPAGLTIGPEGAVYWVEAQPAPSGRVRTLAPDGTVRTVIGNLHLPTDVSFGPDGSLYVTERFAHRVWRRLPSGAVVLFAGTGVAGYSGDRGPATLARLNQPTGVAVGSDGAVFVMDYANRRVRRISPDGTIATVAGNGSYFYNGDNRLATTASLANPFDVAVTPDGSLLIPEEEGFRIRRVTPDGIIHTAAGSGVVFGRTRCEGCRATESLVHFPRSVTAAPDGGFYYVEWPNGGDPNGAASRIRRVLADGSVVTVALSTVVVPAEPTYGDGGPLASGFIALADTVALSRDGRVAFTQNFTGLGPEGSRIRIVRPPFPSYGFSEAVFPSEDGAVTHLFDASGRLLKSDDALTGSPRLSFGYDAAGRLAAITDSDGNVTRLERDASGAPTAIVAPGGQRTQLTIDGNGWLASIANPAGETARMVNRADGLLEEFTRPRGNAFRFTWDDGGRLLRADDPAGGSIEFGRTGGARSFVMEKRTAEGRATTYALQRSLGLPERRVNTAPSGTATMSTRGTDERTVVVNADGSSMTATLAPDPRFGMAAPLASRVEAHTPGGLFSVSTHTRTAVVSGATLTRQTDVTTINGRAFTSVFDAASRTVTATSPEGRTRTITLDAEGRVASASVPTLAPVTLTRDSFGRVTRVEASDGVTTRAYVLGYDAKHRLVSVTDPLLRTVIFDHDLADRVTRQTLPDASHVDFTFDANGSLATLSPPDKPAHSFDRTPVDLESRYSPPPVAGSGTNDTTYDYNLDRQLETETRPDLQAIRRVYQPASGRLASLSHAHATIDFAYEPATGRLASMTATSGGSIAFSYDGPLTTREDTTGPVPGSVSRVFDADFRLREERVNGTHPVTYSYDRDGLVTAAGDLSLTRDPATGAIRSATVGGVTEARDYNAFGELPRIRSEAFGALVYEALYSRDALGRITTKTETTDGVTNVHEYRYDRVGRLEEVLIDGVTSAFYAYDRNGNRLSRTAGGTVEHGVCDAQDRLLSYGDATYTYTPNGELATKTDPSGTTAYVHDALSNLRQVTLPNGDVIEYVIDARNRWVGKKVNGAWVQRFLYRGQLQPVAELDGSGSVVSRFVFATKVNVPDYIEKPATGAVWRVVTDHLGSVRAVVDDATGAVVQRIDYNEFGRVLSDTNPGAQPFGFAGGLIDVDTGLVRFGARDFDPEVGRWTTKDPIRFRGGVNVYAYADLDPVNRVDRNGLRSDFDIRDDDWDGAPWTAPLPPGDEIAGAIKDMMDAKEALYEIGPYFDWVNGEGRPDWYFHCIGNCSAKARGPFGSGTAACIGYANEVYDFFKPGDHTWADAWEEGKTDLEINSVGRQGPVDGSCVERCRQYGFDDGTFRAP